MMIKKTIILGFTLALLSNMYGQTGRVGINTENPTSALDVNGSVRTSGNLRVGGDNDIAGSAGTTGQFLISQGAGLAPTWETITTPVPDTGDWALLGSISRTDTKGGLRFSDKEDSGALDYQHGYTISQLKGSTVGNVWSFGANTWKEFEDFALELPAFDDSVRIVINLQVLNQAFWASSTTTPEREAWISYAIGVFLEKTPQYISYERDGLMLASRQGGCRGFLAPGSNTPMELSTMTVTLTNLPVNKAIKLLILGTRRSDGGIFTTNSYLSIGKLMDGSTVDDSLLRRATMRADIYKKVRRTP